MVEFWEIFKSGSRYESHCVVAGINLPQEEVDRIKHTLISECSRAGDEPKNSKDKGATPTESQDTEAGQVDNKAQEAQLPQAEEKKRVPSLDGLLKARKSLKALISQQLDRTFDVSFNGVETGEVEAVVKARWQHDEVRFIIAHLCKFCIFFPITCDSAC